MADDLVTILIGPSAASLRVPEALVMRQSLLDTIDRTERELIVVGFMIDDPMIVDRISSMASGTIVEVHVDKKQTEKFQTAMAAAEKMRRSGAVVTMHDEGNRESLHAKVVISDSTEAIVGSANLTSRGADRNYEVGVRIRGPSVKILRRAVLQNLQLGSVDDASI